MVSLKLQMRSLPILNQTPVVRGNYVDIEILLRIRLPSDEAIHAVKHLTCWQRIPVFRQVVHEILDTI